MKRAANEIFIPNNKEVIAINGDIRNEKTTIKLKEFQNLTLKNFSIIKDQEITFETKSKFSSNTYRNVPKRLVLSCGLPHAPGATDIALEGDFGPRRREPLPRQLHYPADLQHPV